MKRLDRRNLNPGKDEIICFARIRNEALRLPWWFEFHRTLGVDRFVIVDNESTDGSLEYLLSCQDVHVFWTQASYAESQSGMAWVNRLLNDIAPGHWAATLDPDELLIYPGFEQVDLKRLTRFLDRTRADALISPIIDMYSSAAIRDTRYEPGRDFLEYCPYFDSEPLKEMRGGARERLFWRGRTRIARPPYLGKIPLVRWRSDLAYEVGTHLIANVQPSPVQGALLHFKMFNDFHEKVAIAVKERQYWESSGQYACYLAGLDENPGLTALHDGSIRFENSEQMLRLGFMHTSPEYTEFLASLAPGADNARADDIGGRLPG
jgi:hypothetical protein